MHVKQENLKKLLKPRHIVFIGGQKMIEQGIKNVKRIGFTGTVYAVNKRVQEIEGIHCYKNVNEIPIIPDAAFIAVRGASAVELVKELREKGVPGCVCYAAGFSEIGNQQLNDELIEAAQEMALVGPNCYGIINYLDQVPLWPDHFGLQKTTQGVAILSQSGNLSFNMTMNDRSVPIAYMMDVGNQAILDLADYITVLCGDPRVTAIGLHIEGLGDIEKFCQAAQFALNQGVPIVAFKTGVSEIGSQLTMSHTSSLAGADDLYDALFKRLHISRVDSLASFLETLKLFSVTGGIKSRNLGVLTVSGGESAIAADIAEQKEFVLPSLTNKQKEDIHSLMAGFEHVSNPLDYNTSLWGNKEKLEKCFTSFMQEKFDTSLLILDYLDKENIDLNLWEITLEAFIQTHQKIKKQALVISVLPEGMPIHFREKLIDHGITPLQGITEAFTALHAAAVYYERTLFNQSIPTNLLLPIRQPVESNSLVWSEWQGKQALHSYGVTIPNGKVVSVNDEFLIDERMQAPFVVKGLSHTIVHKTDVGGVQLNLQTEEEIREALFQMQMNLVDMFGQDMQFLVEEMVTGAVAELNIGIKRDKQFGLVLIISMGGELVNLMNDSIPLLLPTNRIEIMEALYSLKGIKLLRGFRGRPEGDIEAVVTAAEYIAAFAEANRNHILEMDVNPLIVLPKGQGVVAVDAFIRTAADVGETEGDQEGIA